MKRSGAKSDDARRIEKIAALLRQGRRELLAEYEQCEAELDGAADADPDEEGTLEQTCSSAVDILGHLRAEIREFDDALERLKEGQYGLCADCGAPIPAERLKALPTARRCMSCQTGSERKVG